ncbi:hypothetical protein FH972_025682 [Carpinus fangiana]|uniref:cyclic pyranopterin monophosphate synthase n=1 Tax=Carpinus fangiana TaxID=176857 RepID=A0A5N6L248_9ROSI|nr:hypothetical protein FH972_025682 [Carpinus fangiana]
MVHIPPPFAPNDTTASSPAIKLPTARVAVARCILHFSNTSALPLIRSSNLKKGDALSVARIAGIMGAKKTADLIPLCHNIPLSGVSVDVDAVGAGETSPALVLSKAGEPVERGKDECIGEFGGVVVTARVHTFGQTGVEMEALTAVMTAGLTVYDMCKAVDKGMRIEGCRVVLKEGGKSGRWVEGGC